MVNGFFDNTHVLWAAGISGGLGIFATAILCVFIFSRIVKASIVAHETEEKKINEARLREDEKRHNDRLAEDAKHHAERLEDSRRWHAETLGAVRALVEGASRFPAQVAAQYQRVNAEIDETSERVDNLDERITKIENAHGELKERLDRIITRGGLPT